MLRIAQIVTATGYVSAVVRPKYPLVAPDGMTFIELADDSPDVAGYTWDGESFTAPQASSVIKWDALDFMRLFTQAERIAIRTLAKSNAAAEDFLDLLDKAAATGTLVHSNDPDLLAALSAFETAGVIAEGRAAEIVGS